MASSLFIFVFCVAVLSFCSSFPGEEQPDLNSEERAAITNLRDVLGLNDERWPTDVNPCLWQGIQCSGGNVVAIDVSSFALARTRTHVGRYNISLSNFTLPRVIPTSFGYAFPNLKVLDLSLCLINGEIPSSLGELYYLELLNLSSNSIVGQIPKSFEALGNLVKLDLGSNSLSGPMGLKFENSYQLRWVILRDNQFSQNLHKDVFVISKLEVLDLSHNSFSGKLPNLEGSSHVAKFGMVDLSNNYFRGETPNFARRAKLEKNCMWNEPDQRAFEECTRFYPSNVTYPGRPPSNFMINFDGFMSTFLPMMCFVVVAIFVACLTGGCLYGIRTGQARNPPIPPTRIDWEHQD